MISYYTTYPQNGLFFLTLAAQTQILQIQIRTNRKTGSEQRHQRQSRNYKPLHRHTKRVPFIVIIYPQHLRRLILHHLLREDHLQQPPHRHRIHQRFIPNRTPPPPQRIHLLIRIRAHLAIGFAQLDIALDHNVHDVGEFERVEEGVRDHRSARIAGIAGLLERAKQFRFQHTTVIVGQIDFVRASRILRFALFDLYVETRIASHRHHQREGFADFHQPVGRFGEWTAANLNIKFRHRRITAERDDFLRQHVHAQRNRQRLIQIALPETPNRPNCIPNLLDTSLILQHQHILQIGLPLRVERIHKLGTAGIQTDGETIFCFTRILVDVPTIGIAVETFRIDDTVELTVEFDVDGHHVFGALDVDGVDVRWMT